MLLNILTYSKIYLPQEIPLKIKIKMNNKRNRKILKKSLRKKDNKMMRMNKNRKRQKKLDT